MAILIAQSKILLMSELPLKLIFLIPLIYLLLKVDPQQ